MKSVGYLRACFASVPFEIDVPCCSLEAKRALGLIIEVQLVFYVISIRIMPACFAFSASSFITPAHTRVLGV